MAQEIRAGVRLNLNDQFSPDLRRAGLNVQGFGEKAAGVAGKVNQAFSGLAGTLAAVGVGIGTAALVREAIGFEDAIRRIATNAGAFDDEADEFGRHLLDVAYNAKVPAQEQLAFASAAAESAVSLDDIAYNMPFMADLIQGVGVSGAEAGQLLSQFLNRGADADTLREKLNNIVEISARIGNVSIPELLRYLPSLLEAGGSGLDGIEDMVIAVNMLRMGTNRAAQAAYQYRAAMTDFARPEVREAIQQHVNFRITDESTFAEIMAALSEFGGGNEDRIANFGRGLHLSSATVLAFQQFDSHFERTLENLGELGDASGAIARRAEQNAATIQGSLNRLRIAASEFASSSLIRPIEWLANRLDSNPQGMRNAVVGLTAAVAALGGMKALTTVMMFITSLKSIKGGGNIGAGFSGAGIPVKVTNMGAGGFGGGNAAGGGKRAVSLGRTAAAGAGMGAVLAAAQSLPQMAAELREIRGDEYLTSRERGEAKGGAIGDAAGSIIGTAAGGAAGMAAGALLGAKKGAALGTIVPGIGNIVGLVVGAGIGAAAGHFGGRSGREICFRIGGGAGGGDYPFAMKTSSYLLVQGRAA
ncbi:MAG: hypothetical protein FWC65_04230, partial [Treponema sp.]|nr:hypothetical protein [Treponema sp.]